MVIYLFIYDFVILSVKEGFDPIQSDSNKIH